MAWCDGVFTLNVASLLAEHKKSGKTCMMVAVEPVLPYGLLTLKGDQVVGLQEKPVLKDMWVSAGIFALNPRVFDDISDDAASWETDVLPALAATDQLVVYRHSGFWKSVDTPKDVAALAGFDLPDGQGGGSA